MVGVRFPSASSHLSVFLRMLPFMSAPASILLLYRPAPPTIIKGAPTISKALIDNNNRMLDWGRPDGHPAFASLSPPTADSDSDTDSSFDRPGLIGADIDLRAGWPG